MPNSWPEPLDLANWQFANQQSASYSLKLGFAHVIHFPTVSDDSRTAAAISAASES